MSYTNKTKIENYLMIDIDSSFDSQVEDWISAAELYINKYTNRPGGFEEPSSASAKYYDGNGKSEIDIDDFTEIDSVQILELDGDDVEYTLTEGKASDFITFPYNSNPKYRLILTPSSQVGGWYGGDKRIKVTAKWAFDTSIPKDIELVATQLVSGVIEKGLKGGYVISESLGDYSVEYFARSANWEEISKDLGIKTILDKYKIFTL